MLSRSSASISLHRYLSLIYIFFTANISQKTYQLSAKNNDCNRRESFHSRNSIKKIRELFDYISTRKIIFLLFVYS